ncbi:MAG: lytic transglycosylase domain-containing protein [Deltaproteobacteria bacterium]|nr:lytic transglycosylase domain-containing protein [Deltaproteobacteria bacterium]
MVDRTRPREARRRRVSSARHEPGQQLSLPLGISARHGRAPRLRHTGESRFVQRPTAERFAAALLTQHDPAKAASKRAMKALLLAVALALVATSTLVWSSVTWNDAPVREGMLGAIDAALTRAIDRLVAGRWRPAPASFRDFADQTLAPTLTAPRFSLDTRGAVRSIFAERSKLELKDAVRVADALVDEAQAVGIDPLLLVAVIDVESKFDHQATSLRGARGLMQLMPETRAWMIDRTPELWSETGKDDALSPESNVRVGVRYFAHLKKGFRRLDHLLQAYNCGPGRLVEILSGKAVLPEETKFYAERVQRIYSRLRRDFVYAKT